MTHATIDLVDRYRQGQRLMGRDREATIAAKRTIPDKQAGRVTRRADVRLWLRLLSCSTVIEKRLRRGFAEEFGTTLPRFDVMAALDRRRDGLTMGELSHALLVSNGNVTGVVRQLEHSGFVAISAVPGDRRSFVVKLTPDGIAHFAELAAAHHRWVRQMLAGVPRQQQEQLFELLALVKSSIAAASHDEDK